MDMDMALNMTMLTTYDNWEATWVTLMYFFREATLESYCGYVIHSPFSLPDTSHLVEPVQPRNNNFRSYVANCPSN
jgi:hypothetical protein